MKNNVKLTIVNFCELITMMVSKDTWKAVAGVVVSVASVSGLSESSASWFGCLSCFFQAYQGGMAGTFLCLLCG